MSQETRLNSILSLSPEARAKRKAALEKAEREKQRERERVLAAHELDRKQRRAPAAARSAIQREDDSGQRWSPVGRARTPPKPDRESKSQTMPYGIGDVEALLNNHFRERQTHRGFNKPRGRKR